MRIYGARQVGTLFNIKNFIFLGVPLAAQGSGHSALRFASVLR
ncbi:MAG: hypothetical protein NZ519_13605 [Bacteroidia bacterium]|nr:hypothetical protein [Bacteroidia bacterium]